MRISIKQEPGVDHTHARSVTVVDDLLDTHGHTIWTAPDGKGLWVDGQQVLGRTAANNDSAVRRYFTQRYS